MTISPLLLDQGNQPAKGIQCSGKLRPFTSHCGESAMPSVHCVDPLQVLLSLPFIRTPPKRPSHSGPSDDVPKLVRCDYMREHSSAHALLFSHQRPAEFQTVLFDGRMCHTTWGHPCSLSSHLISFSLQRQRNGCCSAGRDRGTERQVFHSQLRLAARRSTVATHRHMR